MKGFRLLKNDEIECRVQRCTEKGVSLLLYKTARTDADLLDETFGPSKWENDFKLVDGVLYGGIGVDYGNGLVWKWDAGTESNTEAEKGRASDAFKRAGFKHGIGRELYSAPFIWIPADKCEIKNMNGRLVCNTPFAVSGIGYDKNEKITSLAIVNARNGGSVWAMNAEPQKKPEPEPERPRLMTYLCASCGTKIEAVKNSRGKVQSVEQQIEYSRKTFGLDLCLACAKKEYMARLEKEAEHDAE